VAATTTAGGLPRPSWRPSRAPVTPDFPKKTKCYLYVCQDLVSYTYSGIIVNNRNNIM
jgi:hypothetical protein